MWTLSTWKLQQGFFRCHYGYWGSGLNRSDTRPRNKSLFDCSRQFSTRHFIFFVWCTRVNFDLVQHLRRDVNPTAVKHDYNRIVQSYALVHFKCKSQRHWFCTKVSLFTYKRLISFRSLIGCCVFFVHDSFPLFSPVNEQITVTFYT